MFGQFNALSVVKKPEGFKITDYLSFYHCLKSGQRNDHLLAPRKNIKYMIKQSLKDSFQSLEIQHEILNYDKKAPLVFGNDTVEIVSSLCKLSTYD